MSSRACVEKVEADFWLELRDEVERELLEFDKELWRTKLEDMFCPQRQAEWDCLYNIAREHKHIDIRCDSREIVGKNIDILRNSGYYPAKIQEVVLMFNLKDKGWGFLF